MPVEHEWNVLYRHVDGKVCFEWCIDMKKCHFYMQNWRQALWKPAKKAQVSLQSRLVWLNQHREWIRKLWWNRLKYYRSQQDSRSIPCMASVVIMSLFVWFGLLNYYSWDYDSAADKGARLALHEGLNSWHWPLRISSNNYNCERSPKSSDSAHLPQMSPVLLLIQHNYFIGILMKISFTCVLKFSLVETKNIHLCGIYHFLRTSQTTLRPMICEVYSLLQ